MTIIDSFLVSTVSNSLGSLIAAVCTIAFVRLLQYWYVIGSLGTYFNENDPSQSISLKYSWVLNRMVITGKAHNDNAKSKDKIARFTASLPINEKTDFSGKYNYLNETNASCCLDRGSITILVEEKTARVKFESSTHGYSALEITYKKK